MAILNYNDVFRNTENFYLKETKDLASPHLIKFATERAGEKILDIGCATGDYCLQLVRQGFKCVGVDNNVEYVEKAKSKGVEAYTMEASSLDFEDKSFDTVILFEILEHATNFSKILKEAKRVARKNILITVPNNTQFKDLSLLGLTFEHMLDENHVNFFTKESLEKLLKENFTEYTISEREPLVIAPRGLRMLAYVLYKVKIVRPLGYFRLYAEAMI